MAETGGTTAVTTGGAFDVMGGSSVALLGYNVVCIKCTGTESTTGGKEKIYLPNGFKPLSILPALVGTCSEIKTDSSNQNKKYVTISDSVKGAVYFIIGQN